VSRVPVSVARAAPADLPAGWVALQTRGCPCCTGRVEMQVTLARLIRTQRPNGVVVVLPDASHLPALRKALSEWPLSESVELAGAEAR
jgi:G3E family GTPase